MASGKKIEFHYIKSANFKSFLATGVYGGVSAQGLIQAAFYIERTPIPQKAVWKVEDNGTLGEEILDEKISKNGIIREVDCNIMLDLNTAKRVRDWLSNHIDSLEQIQKSLPGEEERKTTKD